MTNLVASPLVGDGCLTAVGGKPRRYFWHSKFSPTKVGAQFLRHRLRTEVRSMVCFWLRHQLRTEVLSTVCFWLRHQLRTKARSMDGFC